MELRTPPALHSRLPCGSRRASILGAAAAANPAASSTGGQEGEGDQRPLLGHTYRQGGPLGARALGKLLCPLWLQFPFNKMVRTLPCAPAGNLKGTAGHRLGRYSFSGSSWMFPGHFTLTRCKMALGKASPQICSSSFGIAPPTPTLPPKALGLLPDATPAPRPGTRACEHPSNLSSPPASPSHPRSCHFQ